jgi:peptide deformylase
MSDVLQVRYWADPILSTICEPVRDTEFGSKLEEFASQLLTTMNTHKGIGLAAPQVGIARRIFIMHFPESAKEGKLTSPPLVACNPTLELSGETLYEQEGCLSVPTIFEQVARPKTAVMRYFTVLGEEQEVELHNMNARVAAHEFDHLNGIMFFDRRRVSKQVNKAVERAWEKQKRKIFIKKSAKVG